ncbi:MAG TPA: IscS subfamily cysteine desulfurase [Steroidobacter sp.]|uniref:IscS subfamily cysteine desulfurase n=1 Tax=Steroidobacter sp. TaxID=1978227 RepID=UPI002ED9D3C2
MSTTKATTIYLDYAATTPVDPRVAEVMIECLRPEGAHGNPSSMGHDFGRRARALVEKARQQVAAAIGARPESIIWTSGATESDNLAIFGVARFHADRGRHVITARTEHKAVLDAFKQLEKEGFEVTWLKPGSDGIVRPEQVREALRPDTQLVSIMHVNNETGVIQDVAAIGAICRERGVAFHVDAAQSAGKLPLNVEAMNIDLLSLTAHKSYGPKGIGVLYVRRKPPLGLRPLFYGGGQEAGLRSGTLPTHQIVGMGEAFEIGERDRESDVARISALRDRLWEGLSALGGVELNGSPTERVSGVLNVCFHGVEGESLRFALRDIAVSSGSACASGSDEASYVLRALGRSDQLAQSSIRFSLGRFTTADEIDRAIASVTREVNRLRTLSPVSKQSG